MNRRDLIDFATAESLRMETLASQYQQMGFKEVARWLRAQARGAMRYASREVEG